MASKDKVSQFPLNHLRTTQNNSHRPSFKTASQLCAGEVRFGRRRSRRR